jgi:hypothetical protein
MVRCSCTTREGKFRKCGLCRSKNVFRCQARPDRIERLKPVKQVCVLRSRDSSCESLVEVVMCVDQSREQHVTTQVKHFVSFRWKNLRRTNLLNEAISHKKTTIGVFPQVVVHCSDVSMFNEESRHKISLSIKGSIMCPFFVRPPSNTYTLQPKPQRLNLSDNLT